MQLSLNPIKEENLLVSVCMITYNHQDYIRQAVEGVLMQKCIFNVELIIADDCSPDKTREVIEGIIKTHRNSNWIKYTRHEENFGVIKNFLWALNSCTGKYIAICEGDDYWIDPYKLQKQVDFLELNPQYGLVYTDVNFYYQKENKLVNSVFKNGFIKNKIDFNWHLIHTGYFAPCTWLCKKEYLPNAKKFDYVDGTFPWLLDVMANSNVYYLAETTANYRILKESASHSNNKNKNSCFLENVYKIQLEYVNKYKVDESILKLIKQRHYYNLLNISILSNDNQSINECFDYFLKNPKMPLKYIIVFGLSIFGIGRKIIKLLLHFKT